MNMASEKKLELQRFCFICKSNEAIVRYLVMVFKEITGVIQKWNRTFIELIEFRECDKSLKHDLGVNVKILSVTCVFLVQR